MTISELITALEATREERGDLPVYVLGEDWHDLIDPELHLEEELGDFVVLDEEI